MCTRSQWEPVAGESTWGKGWELELERSGIT